jgi:hypothetical protein
MSNGSAGTKDKDVYNYHVRCVRRPIGQTDTIPYITHNSNTLEVYPIDNSDALRWESGESDIYQAESDDNGYTNTYEIYSSEGVGYEYAAKLCWELTAYGRNDWYLPAKDEMTSIYNNKVKIAGIDESAFYWASTQRNSSNSDHRYAYAINMQNGTLSTYDKDQYKFHVRCVRQ